MKRKSEREIMSATRPEDIFTMDLDIIEQEKCEYIERFKPTEYRAIQNFMVTRQITLLYEEAISKINNGWSSNELTICAKNGKVYNIHYNNSFPFKLGQMYLTSKYVIYVVNGRYQKYYKNYITKTHSYLKPDMKIWEFAQYMVPNVEINFETEEGNFCIFVKKPCERMYPMREILEYFNGSLRPEYVASILTRLYYFACYMSLVETTHNGITIDNLFFAPGRRTEEGESYTVEDMRILGVYGGWFFTTYFNEKIQAVPKEVYEVLPFECKDRGYSSFEVDELSIKKVAKELLGSQPNVPLPMQEWVNKTTISKDPKTEYHNWEEVRSKSFGGRRFVDMDVSI